MAQEKHDDSWWVNAGDFFAELEGNATVGAGHPRHYRKKKEMNQNVMQHQFSGHRFTLVKGPDPYTWHALELSKCDSGTGDSYSIFLNHGEPDDLEALGTFLIRAAEKVRQTRQEKQVED